MAAAVDNGLRRALDAAYPKWVAVGSDQFDTYPDGCRVAGGWCAMERDVYSRAMTPREARDVQDSDWRWAAPGHEDGDIDGEWEWNWDPPDGEEEDAEQEDIDEKDIDRSLLDPYLAGLTPQDSILSENPSTEWEDEGDGLVSSSGVAWVVVHLLQSPGPNPNVV